MWCLVRWVNNRITGLASLVDGNLRNLGPQHAKKLPPKSRIHAHVGYFLYLFFFKAQTIRGLREEHRIFADEGRSERKDIIGL